MCDTLVELREGMRRCAAGFDAAVLSATDAQAAVEVARSKASPPTLKALAAARVAEAGGWKAAGERSAAHHLAQATGSSVAQPVKAIETGRRLEQLAVVDGAARAGALSAQQAAVLAGAAAADPGAEARLVGAARESSLGELAVVPRASFASTPWEDVVTRPPPRATSSSRVNARPGERSVSCPASGRWRCRRCATCSTPATRSWPRS